MNLYMVRHGETKWNKERRIQGWADIPLNDFGRHLAQQTAKGLCPIAFDAAITSPLSRAKETAEIILGDRDVLLVEDERIQEIGFGEYEGLCCDKEEWNIPNPEFENFFKAPEKYIPPKEGESIPALLERLRSFLDELYTKKEMKDSNVLIVTHGAALCGMLTLMKQTPIEAYWAGGVHKNCAVTIVEVKGQNPTILEEGKVFYTDETRACKPQLKEKIKR